MLRKNIGEMVDINCCGCSACSNICPTGCISMKANREGFLYPYVDTTKCVKCGKCETVCPVIKTVKVDNKNNIDCYACINPDEEVRMKCSSGGVFPALAQMIIDDGGKVYGAAFSEDAGVLHKGIEKKDLLYELYGSKYVQSRMDDTYKRVKEELEEGRSILFSGTPCQIAGLKSFLEKDYPSLYCIDVVCHGVPSPLVWQRYLEYREEKIGKKLDKKLKPSFREKRKGWERYHIMIPFCDSKLYQKRFDRDLYMKAFLMNIDLRESCYQCKFKGEFSESDIVLGDFWGIQKVKPELYDDKGVSLVVLRTDKGKKLFHKIKKDLIYEEVEYERAIRYNSAIVKSVQRPQRRDSFFSSIEQENIGKGLGKMTKQKLIVKIWNMLIELGSNIKSICIKN